MKNSFRPLGRGGTQRVRVRVSLKSVRVRVSLKRVRVRVSLNPKPLGGGTQPRCCDKQGSTLFLVSLSLIP